MKCIFVSQRVDVHPDYGERRDALDQQWSRLLWKLGYLCVPVPNDARIVSEMLKSTPSDGMLLSGGNSHVKYGGTAPERDAVDELLISHAMYNTIPLLGVCRGMQSIVLHFGGSLKMVAGHVATRHLLDCGREVNSYHEYSPEMLPDILSIEAKAEDGKVEWIMHKSSPICGIMWHPEREASLEADDAELIRKVFGGN